jgi:fused signal recognition particle receptor
VSADAAPALPEPPASPPAARDAQAASGYAAPLLEAVAQALAARAAAPDAGAALVQELERIQHALQARDPQRIRRDSGLLGRLLGRDLERQAEAETLQAQLGVVLLRADGHAEALQRAGQAHADMADVAEAGMAALERWIAAAPAPDPALAPAWSRRLDHLRRLAAAWRLEAAQWRLLQQQGDDLLQRYRHIREVLLPAWRQAATAPQAARGGDQTARAAQAQRHILAELQAMRARLR